MNADGGGGWDEMQLFRSDTANIVINCDQGTIMSGSTSLGTFKNFEWGTIDGGSGNDIITGFSNGFDSLGGGDGNGSLYGGSQADGLSGGTGDDKLFGGGGNDDLGGNDGNNVIKGGDGDDTIESFGHDKVDGGAGNDILRIDPVNMVAGTEYAGKGGQ